MNGQRHIPLINGTMHSWASIIVNITGVPETQVTAIDYVDKQAIENIYGAGQLPIGRGYGRIECEASITLKKGAVDAIRSASLTGRLQDLAPFDIQVSFVMTNGSAKVHTHTIKNCQFKEDKFSAKENDLSLEYQLPLVVSHIDYGK